MHDYYPQRSLLKLQSVEQWISNIKGIIPLEILELHALNMVEAKVTESIAAKKHAAENVNPQEGSDAIEQTP